MNTRKSLTMMILLSAMIAASADETPPESADLLELQQRVADQTREIMERHETELRELSDTDPAALASDPDARRRLEEEVPAFEQQRKAADQAFEQ